VIEVFRDSKASLVQQVRKDSKEIKDSKASLVQQVHKDSKEIKDSKENKVLENTSMDQQHQIPKKKD
jgi:hypothetical protein